jgi:predicted transcriptional regulator
MEDQSEGGLKFSLRLSGDMAAQARQLAATRRTTPYRVIKDVLATALPAALAEAKGPKTTPEALAAQLEENRKAINWQSRMMQSSVDFTAETLMLLRRISEELSSSRDPSSRQALWRSVKRQVEELKAPQAAEESE